MDRIAKCMDCEKLLTDQNEYCLGCGSKRKGVFVSISDSCGINIRLQVRGKVKEEGLKKPSREFIHGCEICKCNGRWVLKDRIIDRKNHQYMEVVRDEETGEIIHECKEPLTYHFNHGSAKFKKLK